MATNKSKPSPTTRCTKTEQNPAKLRQASQHGRTGTLMFSSDTARVGHARALYAALSVDRGRKRGNRTQTALTLGLLEAQILEADSPDAITAVARELSASLSYKALDNQWFFAQGALSSVGKRLKIRDYAWLLKSAAMVLAARNEATSSRSLDAALLDARRCAMRADGETVAVVRSLATSPQYQHADAAWYDTQMEAFEAGPVAEIHHPDDAGVRHDAFMLIAARCAARYEAN